MTTGAEWLDQARRLLDSLRTAGAAGRPAGETPAGSSPAPGGDCRWCPLCQAAAVIRGERPEVSAALADILATTADALRQFAAEPAPGAPAGTPAAAGEAPEVAADEAAPSARPVQRIELT